MKIPVRFAAGFDELSRVRPCESSGSEHSADLSDLVNSFLEREIGDRREMEDLGDVIDGEDEQESSTPDVESRISLENLFDCQNDAVRKSITAEVAMVYREIAGDDRFSSSPDFKRRLMARLRSRGIDAGLCKSRWEKTTRRPAGEYEYIDVITGSCRYIVEVSLAGEFTIARPSGGYAALLEVFPQIFVGRVEDLKPLVRLMCKAVKRSMASAGIHVPPWRRLAYMELKWFGPYKRTTNEIGCWPAGHKINGGDLTEKFVPFQGITLRCRQELAEVRIGNLSALVGNGATR